MNFLVLLIGSVIAFLIIRYRKYLNDFFGDMPTIEKYLGVGHTQTFFVLLGIFIFVLSLMYALGTIQGVIQSTVGKIF